MTVPGSDDKPTSEQGQVTETEKIHPNNTVRWPSRIFNFIEDLISIRLNALIILFMMLLIVTEIFSRKAFNVSIPAVVDIVILCMLVLVFASLSGIQREEAHLKIDIITEKLKGKTAGVTLELINRLLTLAVSFVLFYIALIAAIKAYQHNTMTMAALLLTWPAVAFIPIGFFLICIRLIIQFKQDLASTRRR